MDKKKCSKCKQFKNLDQFYAHKRSGLEYLCKDCVKTRDRNRHKEIIRFVDSLKTPCILCGESDFACIEFHHVIQDNKKFEVSSCGRRSKKSLEHESKKCVCVCANCHRKIHLKSHPLKLSYELTQEYREKHEKECQMSVMEAH